MNDERIIYRLKFSKFSRVRFIGHLDLLNVFQRAVKRAGLPIAYSQGFNPHQEISFALPLTLGYYSEGDYADLTFSEKINPETIVEKLNAALPDGILVLAARQLLAGERSAPSLISAALYEAVLPDGGVTIDESVMQRFVERKEIIVTKTTKKKTSEINIRPDIHRLELYTNGQDNQGMRMLIAAGSMKNLKADQVVSAVYETAGGVYQPYKTIYIRKEMFFTRNNTFLNLMEKSTSGDKQ